jgi:hypothetical protein
VSPSIISAARNVLAQHIALEMLMRPLPFIDIHETAALDTSPLHVCAGFGFKLFDNVWVITRLVAPFLLQSIGFIAVHGCRPRHSPRSRHYQRLR